MPRWHACPLATGCRALDPTARSTVDASSGERVERIRCDVVVHRTVRTKNPLLSYSHLSLPE